MMIYRAPNREVEGEAPPPSAEEMQRMGAFIQELTDEGVLLNTGGMMASSTGARVRRQGDTITVVDGPFTEAKELIAGYAIVKVDSKAEAINVAERFLAIAGDGESEIRQMWAE